MGYPDSLGGNLGNVKISRISFEVPIHKHFSRSQDYNPVHKYAGGRSLMRCGFKVQACRVLHSFAAHLKLLDQRGHQRGY